MTHPESPCARCGALVPPGAPLCPACGSLRLRPQAVTIGPGTTLDLGDARIVLDARLGEGGMGIVWRGWLFHPPATPRGSEPPLPIALKVLSARARTNPQLRALFLQEAEAMRVLSHPNVVRFHRLVQHGDEVAIAMEYIDGNTLEEVIARHVARARLAGPGALPGLPFRRAWHYVQQLLGALAAMHALGFVHRDVKPSNALLRMDGVLKLSDLGIAQLASAPLARDPNALPPGTGAYMSPEQVQSLPLDGRSDLYSAAIVLFEALSGRTPFDAEERGEILVRRDQVEARPPPLRSFVPQAPPVLDALFERALAKDPARRFGSAIEMGEAFRAALGVPETSEWRAQAELAHVAVAPRVSHSPANEAHRTARIATLRDFLVDRYRTVKLDV